MSSGKPILVVCGATGNQGGSVVAHFLSQSPSPYAIRGITRNTQSEKSLALASKGVEMVAAEFSDRASLDAAFSGASVIFGTTDFWVYYDNDANREKAKAAGKSHVVMSHEFDIQQNKNIIDAAAKVDTLERFVFSSQANVARLSGGKYPECYHFDCKALAEEYGRKAHPKLWARTNVLYVGLYLENNLMPVGEATRPKLNTSTDTLVLNMPEWLLTAKFPMVSVRDDTGALVGALLRGPPGNTVTGVNEWINFKQYSEMIADVLGKKIDFIDESSNELDLGDDDPERNKDNMQMVGWSVEFGYDGHRVDKNVKQPSDLGVSYTLQPIKDWCAKQDWLALISRIP